MYHRPDEKKAIIEEILSEPDILEEKVNHPPHYNAGKIEVIDFLRDQGLGLDFCLGNALKYICRAKHKGNPTEDIAKAIWYLENCGI